MGRPRRNIGRYVFDSRSGRYRDTTTGRYISEQYIMNVIEDRIDIGVDNLIEMSQTARASGSFDAFREAFAIEIRNLHLQMAILGGGGRDNMTPAKWGAVGQILREEYAYLNNFVNNFENISQAEAERRLRMYGNKIYTSYWASRTIQQQDQGYNQERRIVDPSAEHCIDCINLAGLGWQPIGSLPEPGQRSRCLSNCRCRKIYRR